MKLLLKNHISSLLLLYTFASLSLPAFSTPPFWDGVLLANKTDNEITAFIDKSEKIDDLLIIANINGKKISHEVKKYGRLMKITLTQGQLNPTGFIMVKKLGFVVASVRLSEALPTKPYYLKARRDIMKSKDKRNGYIFLSRSYATLNQKSKTQKYSKGAGDILATENLNQGFSLKEERDPNEKIRRDTTNYVYKESTFIITDDDEPLAQKELQARGKKNKKERISNQLVFEKYIHSSRFPLYEPQTKERKISIEVKKDAEKFDGDYRIIEDYHSWLHLEQINSKNRFAFDGASIFKIDQKYFNIRYIDQKKVESFLSKFHLFIKPYSKKLLGIYYQEHEISALKSESDYLVSVINNNTLMIETGGESYILFSDNDYLIIKNKEKRIHKINKNVFHQEEYFYYKD